MLGAPSATFTLAATTVATAVFVCTNEDTEADGQPAWFELRQFGALQQAPTENPDGDGLTTAEEFVRALSPLARDSSLAGGVAARRSASLAFVASAGHGIEPASIWWTEERPS